MGIKMRIRKVCFVAFVSVGLLCLGGCGASKSEMATDSVMNTTSSTANNEITDYKYAQSTEEMPEVESEETSMETPMVQDANRKLIKTVDLSVETKAFDEIVSNVKKRVDELGGYIENLSLYNGSSYNNSNRNRDIFLVLRIPKEQLDSFVEEVEKISNVISRNEYVEDVTLQYVDIESHKEALTTEQTRLLELLEAAESVEDIISIESRLSQVRYEIESMESRLRTYDNQVDYSTINLSLYEVKELSPALTETTWERISGGFVRSVKQVLNGIKEFCIGFIIYLPYILVWGIIIGVVLFLFIRLKRKNRKIKNTEKDMSIKE